VHKSRLYDEEDEIENDRDLTMSHSDNEEDKKKALSEEKEAEKEEEVDTHQPPKHLVDFGIATIHIRLYNGIMYDSTVLDMSLFFDSSELLSTFHTGDLVAFHGRSPLAQAITGGTDTPYSHLGTIIRMPDPKSPDKEEKVFIMESTHNALDVPDHLTGNVHRGVTIFVLKERLRRMDCVASWHIPLAKPLNSKENTKYIEKGLELHAKGIRYDTKQLVSFLLGQHNSEDLSELFCSEFAAVLLRHVERLPPDTNPSASTPSDVVHSVAFNGRAPGIRMDLLRFQVNRTK